MIYRRQQPKRVQPSVAYRALKAEDKIDTMLPCNVIVQEISRGQVKVAAIDPVAPTQSVKDSELVEFRRRFATNFPKLSKAYNPGHRQLPAAFLPVPSVPVHPFTEHPGPPPPAYT